MAWARMAEKGPGPERGPRTRGRSIDARRRRDTALAVLVAFLLPGCAARPRPALMPSSGWTGLAAIVRPACPEAVSMSVRIRLEPSDGPGATIDGTLRAALPDTIALSARLGVFRPFFALRAASDSAELILHEARRYWITARRDEDWRGPNPSAFARALTWSLCPADLLDRLDEPVTVSGSDQVRLLRGHLRDTPFEAELGFGRRDARLVSLRILEGSETVLQLRQRDFRRCGPASVPGVVEMTMPGQRLSVRVEVIGVSCSRPDRPAAVTPLRPEGWEPYLPGDPLFPASGPGQDPG